MAGETFCVITRCVSHDLSMGVVAGHAADPRVVAVVAAAVGETIGLEANIRLSTPMTSDRCLPSAMALAAKIRHIFCRWLANLRWGGDSFRVGKNRHEMRVRIGMAAFAGNAGLHGCKIQIVIEDGMRGMTVEAGLRLLFRDWSSNGLIQRLRTQTFIAGGNT